MVLPPEGEGRGVHASNDLQLTLQDLMVTVDLVPELSEALGCPVLQGPRALLGILEVLQRELRALLNGRPPVESRANFGPQLSGWIALQAPELLMTKVAPRALRTIHLVVVKFLTKCQGTW